jgi:hypothetical protein
MQELSIAELDVIKESLQYSRKHIDEYKDYPSYEFKQEQLKRINDVAEKVSAIIKEKKTFK